LKAIIITDSEGNRLRPLTCTSPKAMLPVLGRPLCEHTLRLLRRHGITDITFITGYCGDAVKKYFEKLELPGVFISFAERKDLEKIISTDDAVIISGSLLTDFDIEKLLLYHDAKGSVLTAVTRIKTDFPEYGTVKTDSTALVTDFARSTSLEHTLPANCISGILVVSKNAPVKDYKNVWLYAKHLLENGAPVYSYPASDYIADICDIDSYFKATRDFLDKKINLPFLYDEKEPGVWVAPDATVEQGSVIVPPVFIGSKSIIERGVRLEAYSVIGKETLVGSGAGIKRSIIMDNAKIGSGSTIRNAVICKNSEAGFESALYEKSILAEGSVIGKHCTLRPGVRIWPGKFIEDESIVSSNIIWENTAPRSLFSEGCVTGRINGEITPEFAARLGLATGRLLGGKIAVSGDRGGGSSMIKNAIISGIQSSGMTAYDFGEQPLPITRSGIRFYSLSGGLSLSTFKRDGAWFVSIDVINSSGANIETDELKKLEEYVSSGDIPRVIAPSINEAEYLFEYKLYYLKQLINSTSKKGLGAKLLIHCPGAWGEELLKSAAADLECEFTFTGHHDPHFLSEQMKSGNYDIGVIIDYKCEALTLITKDGVILSEFDYAALVSLIIMKSFPSAVIYTPFSSPDSIEELASKYNATVHRTELSPPNIMNELSKKEETMFLQQFIYRFDAVGALIKLLDFLHTSSVTLSELLTEIPKSYVINTSVCCPGLKQPETVTKLSKKYTGERLGSSDSIRLSFENGWVIIVPKKNQSAIHVISHGLSEEYAREIADICTDFITK